METTAKSAEEREADRARRRELYERELDAWTDEELAAELRDSYGEASPPPCRICGGPLQLQATGGGSPDRWACSGRNEDMTWKEGRSIADEHYCRSEWTDVRCGGDNRVIELLRRYEAGRG